MPTFGPQLNTARLGFADTSGYDALLAQNLKDTQAVHNSTMNAYSKANAEILADDTLHPDERTKRLKRLEDKVYKDINSFSGNVSQASDTILNSIINEKKDPFYNLDKQYTNVYNAAQANRAKLEAEGKSAFMRDAYGNEIDTLPTLFDKDGKMRSQQDFQFDYEGILDYSKEAETFVNDVVADIYRTSPELVRGKGDVHKLIGDFLRTGNIETTDQNLINVLNTARDAFKQTASYDQMKRRGIEGSADAILERAVEERKYTKEAKVDALLNDIIAKQTADSGKNDLLSTYSPLRPIKEVIADTEEGAKRVNNIVEKVNDKVSGSWTSKGIGTLYSDDVVTFEDGKVTAKKLDVNGENIDTPLTKDRATKTLGYLQTSLNKTETELANIFNSAGLEYIPEAATAAGSALNIVKPNSTIGMGTSGDLRGNRQKLISLKNRVTPKQYQDITDMLDKIDGLKEAKEDITTNLPNLEKNEKEISSQYKTSANELINAGLAGDLQEAYLIIKSIEANESIKDNTSYSISDEGGIKEEGVKIMTGLLQDKTNKFYNIKTGDGDTDDNAETRLRDFNSNPEKLGQAINNNVNDIFSATSNVKFNPRARTVIADGTYAMDPESFKRQYAVLEPSLNLLETLDGITDFTDGSVNKTRKALTEKGARDLPFTMNDKEYVIPKGSIIRTRFINTDDRAVLAVDIIDPNNPNKRQTFPLEDLRDAIDKRVTQQVYETVIPKTEVGKMQGDLEKEQKVAPLTFN